MSDAQISFLSTRDEVDGSEVCGFDLTVSHIRSGLCSLFEHRTILMFDVSLFFFFFFASSLVL